MKTSRSCLVSLLALGVLLAGCRSAGPPAGTAAQSATRPGPGRLQPLDEQNAAAFRAAFDGAKGYDRYVVALSPT